MSTQKGKKEEIVQIKENNLVDLIDNIVTEAVAEQKKVWIAEQKKVWIAEQAKKDKHRNSLLENRIAKLENLLSNAKITKVAK